jgi:GntR family transcriptional regulator/MocR family aminotransferase
MSDNEAAGKCGSRETICSSPLIFDPRPCTSAARRRGKTLVQLPIRIDSKSPHPLKHQIFEQIHDLIRGGQLRPGSALPSSRELSEQLHVSRNTVMEAYESLIKQEYICAQRALGTFVNETIPEDSIVACAPQAPGRTHDQRAAVNLPLPYTG